jgi:pimeloyl-ACP methyl ester carboxylesterase
MTVGIEAWWAAGERVSLTLGGVARAVFVRRLGAGRPVTLLHGFPSSSHDWALLAPELAAQYALLLPDFLGFGASDKPAEHDYSIHEQADLVAALWARERIGSTVLIAHDYGVSVAQELLARRAEGALEAELERVVLLNGGLYPDLHRPEPVQTALLDPEQGPHLSAALTEPLLTSALTPTFPPGYDVAPAAHEIWCSLERDGGQLILHRLIRYMTDRATHAERWTGALESTDVPLAFVWGMLDPISGAHMARRIAERLPGAPLHELADVAHWPALEAPDSVAAAVLGAG